MKLAIIYWTSKGVGGIATHLNALRTCAKLYGDECDILRSWNYKRKKPGLFPERQWVAGGDTRIWVDGELPHGPNVVEESCRWLDDNYDAVHFGYLCPHQHAGYKTPDFMPLYTDTKLPKSTTITDGYWDTYAHWGRPCLPYLSVITSSGNTYGDPLKAEGYEVLPLGMPFVPARGPYNVKDPDRPLIVWPNQWKNIKGVVPFLRAIPKLPPEVDIEMYSCGIRYYQIRKEKVWRDAIRHDYFKQFDGNGRADYYGNTQLSVVLDAMQRAWFTVCLQGITARRETYKKGSYNNTELEALFYGAVPILHESAKNTDLPKGCYLTVSGGEEIPQVVADAIDSGMVFDEERHERAQSWVLSNYSGMKQYETIRSYLA